MLNALSHRRLFSGLALLALTAAASFLSGCKTNAATGRSQLQYFSPEQEIALGTQSKPSMLQEFGGTVPDGQADAYVTEIGKKLAAVTEDYNPGLPWEFTFLNSNVINAFALPGGKVFVTRALVKQMTSEAELAHVLGHEVGHVTARHTNDRMVQATGAQILAGAAGAATKNDRVAQLAANAGSIVVLGYSREQEREADYLGMRYMSRIGYDPAAAIKVMEILNRASGDRSQPQWLQTHPYPEDRIERIKGHLAGEFRATQGNPKYQTYPDRFRQRMLNRLAMLPPPEDDVLARRSVIALNRPETWCAHCAAAAQASLATDATAR